MKIKDLNKKGFTLIELLAVIVILAIILVIAVPSVLDTMNNSKKGVARDQAMLIFKAAETCVANQQALGDDVSTAKNKCNTLDLLSSNKYYTKNGSELASINISDDGTVTKVQYLEKASTQNVMCAYTNGAGKNSIVGGLTNASISAAASVSSTNCK